MMNAQDITVAYGSREILHGVSFSAKPGQVTAIVGPNGSGKTTLLRALTGDLPYTGQAVLNGIDIATAKPWDLAAMRGVLPQATPLAFPFTVAEVVRLGLQRGLEAQETSLISRALARVDLGEFAGRLYQELSGGEQQRVQLARVLAQVWHPVSEDQPHWLFLDEPVSSLDIGHQLQIMQIARDYADQGGGVIAVMHDLNLTAMFADCVALVADGHILEQDSPNTVFRNDLLSHAYKCNLRVNTPPATGAYLLPHAASMAAE
ncbi:MAG: heme ABC transporter ATP-binding protein [Rhodobacteraceae bacterium]|nr:heme ABC transporter ATP-binding protein [Paracoccaceae bacterium]